MGNTEGGRDGVLRFRRPLREADIAWWSEVFGEVTPLQVASRLAHGLPGEKSFEYAIDGPGRTFDLDMRGTHGNAEIWFQATSLNLVTANFHEDGLRVGERFRSAGHAQRLVGNLADLADDLKVPRISLDAVNLGAYMWARAGAVPVGGVGDLTIEMLTRLSRVASSDELDARVAADVQTMILGLNRRPKLMWALAGLKPIVTSYHLFNQGGGESRVKLGQHLLIGTTWKANIELRDGETRMQLGTWRKRWEDVLLAEAQNLRSPPTSEPSAEPER